MAKIKDMGKRASSAQIAERYAATKSRGQVTFNAELRKMQKVANERMRQLEKAGLNSPAYQAIQAQLEVLGKQTKGNRGRRFSETGKATYSEREVQAKILREFLYENKTSTLTGAKQYERDVWESANANNKLTEAGITKDEWIRFWENMPNRKDRMYGSTQIVAMIRAYSMKNGQLEDDNKLSIEEIAEEIQASRNLKSAYKSLGLTLTEVTKAKIKRR